MAIWQYRFFVIEQSNVASMNVQPLGDEEDAEEYLRWDKSVVFDCLDRKLSALLSREKSWSETIRQYGRLDGTCVQIGVDDLGIQEIACSFDVRENKPDLWARMLAVFSDMGGCILHEGKIYENQWETIVESIRKSSAARFCKDPHLFLRSLRDV